MKRRIALLVLTAAALALTSAPSLLRVATAGKDDAGTALAAAARLANAQPGNCAPDDPPGTARVMSAERFYDISVAEWRESTSRGIAVFNLLYCMDSGARLVLGRTPDRGWEFWAGGSAREVQRYLLPGDMLACAGGDGLEILDAPRPDAPVLTVVPDGALVTGEEFVLTWPGTFPDRPGAGWYRLSAPLAGWAYSPLLLDAGLEDCSLRSLVPQPG